MGQLAPQVVCTDVPSLCISLEFETVSIIVGDDREIVAAVTFLHIEMLVVVSAEHYVHTCLVQHRNHMLVKPELSPPAVRELKSRYMDDCNLELCLCEDRILSHFLDPLYLFSTELVELHCS